MVGTEHEPGKPQSGAGIASTEANDRQSVEPGSEGRNRDHGAFDPGVADREALLEKHREMAERLREAEDRVLRVAADADNFKKRMERDKEEATRYANERFIAALLPVIDNLERALEHAESGSHEEGLIQGVKMTLQSFQDTLSKFGCTPVEAEGKQFDPNYHEAVYREATARHPSNTIVRELQKGYVLNDRLLRPAMVVVASSPSTNADDTSGNSHSAGEASAKSHVRIKVNPA